MRNFDQRLLLVIASALIISSGAMLGSVVTILCVALIASVYIFFADLGTEKSPPLAKFFAFYAALFMTIRPLVLYLEWHTERVALTQIITYEQFESFLINQYYVLIVLLFLQWYAGVITPKFRRPQIKASALMARFTSGKATSLAILLMVVFFEAGIILTVLNSGKPLVFLLLNPSERTGEFSGGGYFDLLTRAGLIALAAGIFVERKLVFFVLLFFLTPQMLIFGQKGKLLPFLSTIWLFVYYRNPDKIKLTTIFIFISAPIMAVVHYYYRTFTYAVALNISAPKIEWGNAAKIFHTFDGYTLLNIFGFNIQNVIWPSYFSVVIQAIPKFLFPGKEEFTFTLGADLLRTYYGASEWGIPVTFIGELQYNFGFLWPALLFGWVFFLVKLFPPKNSRLVQLFQAAWFSEIFLIVWGESTIWVKFLIADSVFIFLFLIISNLRRDSLR